LTGDPVLHLLVGPNGAGKSTFWHYVLSPELHLEFVNADEIAAEDSPEDPEGGSYAAAAKASARRDALIGSRTSFATETVFSHESKVALVEAAIEAGYLVTIHVIAVPVGLAVHRVENRVENGGHSVPRAKVRGRYNRLWEHVVASAALVERVFVYDNTIASRPFRPVAEIERGHLLWSEWPDWTPKELRSLSSD
jgi:predicted ABC-type ATPase